MGCGNSAPAAKPLFTAESMKTNPSYYILTAQQLGEFSKTETGYQEFLRRHKSTEKEVPKIIKSCKNDMEKAMQALKDQGMGDMSAMLGAFDGKVIKQGLDVTLEGLKMQVKDSRESYIKNPEGWENVNQQKASEEAQAKAELEEMQQKIMGGQVNFDEQLKKLEEIEQEMKQEQEL